MPIATTTSGPRMNLATFTMEPIADVSGGMLEPQASSRWYSRARASPISSFWPEPQGGEGHQCRSRSSRWTKVSAQPPRLHLHYQTAVLERLRRVDGYTGA